MIDRVYFYLLVVMSCIIMGCANISTPTGGKKDTVPPKLLKVTPADSLLNTRVKKFELQFDEYITVSDVTKEVQISPILTLAPSVNGINKHVTVKLEDSLLEENTTYRISFGNAIRDLHEGNPFSGYTYTFSTGSYFDSLQFGGVVMNAATGFPDSSGIVVVLYNSTEDDSAIVKKKPRYKAKPDSRGVFLFKGLPGRNFRVYAIKDENNNLIYDGGSEMVAFSDSLIRPVDSMVQPVTLRLFAEIPDSGVVADTVKPVKKSIKGKPKVSAATDTVLTYSINVDTADAARRTFDLTDSIRLVFSKGIIVSQDKISLTFDSAETAVKVPLRIRTDSARPGMAWIVSKLAENTVYTLHFDEGFARDTGSLSATKARYRFRTFNDDNYGKIKLMLAGKYLGNAHTKANGPDFVLMIKADNDTLYREKITDTVISFNRLRPGNYTFCIIVDKNKNGKWDTGDLLGKLQPEEVIPAATSLVLKAGWEHTVDFETKPKPKFSDKKGGASNKSVPPK